MSEQLKYVPDMHNEGRDKVVPPEKPFHRPSKVDWMVLGVPSAVGFAVVLGFFELLKAVA